MKKVKYIIMTLLLVGSIVASHLTVAAESLQAALIFHVVDLSTQETIRDIKFATPNTKDVTIQQATQWLIDNGAPFDPIHYIVGDAIDSNRTLSTVQGEVTVNRELTIEIQTLDRDLFEALPAQADNEAIVLNYYNPVKEALEPVSSESKSDATASTSSEAKSTAQDETIVSPVIFVRDVESSGLITKYTPKVNEVKDGVEAYATAKLQQTHPNDRIVRIEHLGKTSQSTADVYNVYVQKATTAIVTTESSAAVSSSGTSSSVVSTSQASNTTKDETSSTTKQATTPAATPAKEQAKLPKTGEENLLTPIAVIISALGIIALLGIAKHRLTK